MQIRYLTQRIQSLHVVIYLLLEAELCLKSFKQTCIAQSMMEFEFIALDKVGEEEE